MRYFDASFITEGKQQIILAYSDNKQYPDEGYVYVVVDDKKYSIIDKPLCLEYYDFFPRLMQFFRLFGKTCEFNTVGI